MLRAVAELNDIGGYFQGMNDIGAVVVWYVPDRQSAGSAESSVCRAIPDDPVRSFWCFVAILRRMDHFGPGAFPGALWKQIGEVGSVLEQTHPQLHGVLNTQAQSATDWVSACCLVFS